METISATATLDEPKPAARWLVALSAGFGVAMAGLPIPVFGSVIPVLAAQWGVHVGAVAAYGMDSFSLGVIFAFFVSHTGIFHRRTRLAMTLLMIADVVPLLLLAHIGQSLWLLAILRFFMGWTFSSMGLQAAVLARWFASGERAISMAFPVGMGLGAIVPGGYLASLMPRLGLHETLYITAACVVISYLLCLALSREPAVSPADTEYEGKLDLREILAVWRIPEIFLLGIGGNAQLWAMFTVGAFLPVFFIHAAGLSEPETGRLMSMFGIFLVLTAFGGAVLAWMFLQAGRKRTRSAAERTSAGLRFGLTMMLLTNALIMLGFLLLLYLSLGLRPMTSAACLLAVFLVSFVNPNGMFFWVAIGDLFPESQRRSRKVAIAVLACGMIAQIGTVIGPFSSSALADSGWPGIFFIAALVQVIGMGAIYAVMRRRQRGAALPLMASPGRL